MKKLEIMVDRGRAVNEASVSDMLGLFSQILKAHYPDWLDGTNQ